MNTCIAEIAAQKSQTAGFGEKSGSFGNKGMVGEFESILAALLGGQSVVQSAASNQSGQIESEGASVAETESPCGNEIPGNHLMAEGQQSILVSQSGGTSCQVNTIDEVCHEIASVAPQATISGIAISLIQHQGSSGVSNAAVESDSITSVLRDINSSRDGEEITESVKASVSQGWMRQGALPKEDAIAWGLKFAEAQIDIAPSKVSSESRAALLEEPLFTPTCNRSTLAEEGRAVADTVSTSNQDANLIFPTSNRAVQSRQILQGNGIDALLSLTSTQTSADEKRIGIFLESKPSFNFPNGLQAGSRLSKGLLIEGLSQVTEIDLESTNNLTAKIGLSVGREVSKGLALGEFRLQGGTDEPSPCDMKTNIELMWRIDSDDIVLQRAEPSAQVDLKTSWENRVLFADRIQFNTCNQRDLALRIPSQASASKSLDTRQSTSRVTGDQIRLPFQFCISNRKQVNDANAFLPAELRAIKAFDEIGSLNQNPKETALCNQIFDKVIDEIQKDIAVKNQASLRISTDDGKRIHVDISLVSNQVRARISVSDAELRDLLASHGWLLVHRFEANGLVAEQVEFSLLGEKQFGESRRERKWAWVESVDDLEEVGGDYETVVVNSSGFDSFA